MRDDKQLIDVLIKENLVPYFYCNMSSFVILEKLVAELNTLKCSSNCLN